MDMLLDATDDGRWPAPEDGGRSTGLDERWLAPHGLVNDRYRVEGVIGRSTSSVVFQARDVILDEAVAIKAFPASVTRAIRDDVLSEVRLARRVAHPFVCRMYDVAQHDGQLFLVMELVSGVTLASMLSCHGTPTQRVAQRISWQLAAALSTAHQRDVLHRDLKPANVMIDTRGDVRLMDFGVACLAHRADHQIGAGTPAYMAPERLLGAAASVSTDVYSLGVVLHELWTGRRPFVDGSLAEHLAAKQAGPRRLHAVVPGLSAEISGLITACLDPDPGRRPASASDVAAQFCRLGGGAGDRCKQLVLGLFTREESGWR